ncbi:MAG: asparagine synthase B [Coprobacillaceae bacterium]
MCGFLVVGSNKISKEVFKECLDICKYRGPDHQHISQEGPITWGFNRLSIMDLSSNGNQPFMYQDNTLVCNGEIYNYKQLSNVVENEYQFISSSDCEVLLPLYHKYGLEITCTFLDAEFAFVLYDNKTNQILAARDPMGIRPMFYGYHKVDSTICFCSEAKGLMNICDDIHPFPPGHYYQDGKFVCYHQISDTPTMHHDSIETIATSLQQKLENAVEKRLQSDAPIGFLLSGGLDSSLVCAIASKKLNKPIRTFAVGMESDPIDLQYAKQVSEYLQTEHTEVIITKKDVLTAVKEVIYHLETFDITTIRASIAMYLLCKYIHENTDIKVILTGEVSDELFGYKYTDYAPSPSAFQQESKKRINELYIYDVLRADRCISAHALEGRVPFADIDFVKYAMAIDPSKKMNTYQKGKYLLRHAFEGKGYLPEDILFREKAAFSDAVGHSMVDYLKEYANKLYSDNELETSKNKYSYCTPFTKEPLLYRDIFESFYPNNSHWIVDFWMPNKEWKNCDVNDPSARVLKNYGTSGK